MKHFWVHHATMMSAATTLILGAPAPAAETRMESGEQPSVVNEEISETPPLIDLDVDSNNMHGFRFEGFDENEDKIEEIPPGKIIISTSNGNTDGDDLWDYADGFNLSGLNPLENTFYPSLASTASAKRMISEPSHVTADLKFVPVKLTLLAGTSKSFDEMALVKFSYGPMSLPEIGPNGLKRAGDGSKAKPYRILPQKAGMRLWRKPAHLRTSGLPVPQGDFIPANTQVKFGDIATSGDTAQLYLEYIDPYVAPAPGETAKPSPAQGLKPIAAEVSEVGVGASVDNVVVTLCPAHVIAHKHDKCGSAGTEVSQDFGNFGYETVVIENGDDDIEPDGTSADYEMNGTQASDKDDDFVKLTFKLSKDARIPGAKVTLVHEAVRIDGKRDTMGKYEVKTGGGKGKKTSTVNVIEKMEGSSKLRFYKENRQPLKASDLVIQDMENPGSGYFAKLITDGKVSVWVEGDRLFGQTVTGKLTQNESATEGDKMGGARVRLVVEQDGVKNDVATVLVYRGGFFLFKQPAGQPGTIGTLEFRDGKGRVNCIGKPWNEGWSLEKRAAVAGTEFTVDEWDMGEVMSDYSWEVRSGKMKDGSQGEPRDGVPHKWGKDYWITEQDNGRSSGHGHTPPGWWYVGRRSDPSPGGYRDTDNHIVKGPAGYYLNGVTGYYQGYYVRWKKDDPESNYATPFVYQRSIEPDKFTGFPDERCGFKSDMYIVPGNYNFGRTFIQMHPDGWRNGSSGCISLQWWRGTKKADKFLRNFSGLKVRVQTN